MHISAREECGSKYDLVAVFAKTILLVLLVYGAVGGFVSCYMINYNKTLCVVVISIVALYSSAIYELKKKWLTNILHIVLLGGFFAYSSQRYWYLNSGYYAIVNRIFEDARTYLGIANRTEYAETVENQYATVTYFVIFIGIICVILLNIHFANKIRLWEVIALTFLPQLLPLYFEKVPATGYVICLLAGYFIAGILDGKGKESFYGRQMAYILPVVFVFTLTGIQVMNAVMPNRIYENYVPQNEQKELTKEPVSQLFLYGAAAVFGGRSNAGISGGMLDGVYSIRPDYETDLIVRFTPYNTAPVYLKAFTSMRYEDNRWYAFDDQREDEDILYLKNEEILYNTMDGLKQSYENGAPYAAKGIMEITKADENMKYSYLPYYTDADETLSTADEMTSIYTYYPYHNDVSGIMEGIHAGYLEVPRSCYDAVEEISLDAELGGSEMEIAGQIDAYFDENYKYTLRPGYAFGNSDYITRFLLNNKKGFCAHFASSATMLFRYMGIPARYVEGYVFSYNEITANAEMVEGAVYEKYFSGYSAIGETGLIELEIPDANAHAWVEIYIKDKGWVVVDPTPMAEPEGEESFWDVFGDLDADIISEGDMITAGEYLEQVVNRAGQVLAWVVVGIVLFFIGKRIYQWRKDEALTTQERIMKNYRALIKSVERKRKDFVAYRTITEQMEWIQLHYRIEEINEEFVDNLYTVFFAPQAEKENEEILLKKIVQIHKKVKRRKFTE